jgi:hypothetical protein
MWDVIGAAVLVVGLLAWWVLSAVDDAAKAKGETDHRRATLDARDYEAARNGGRP